VLELASDRTQNERRHDANQEPVPTREKEIVRRWCSRITPRRRAQARLDQKQEHMMSLAFSSRRLANRAVLRECAAKVAFDGKALSPVTCRIMRDTCATLPKTLSFGIWVDIALMRSLVFIPTLLTALVAIATRKAVGLLLAMLTAN
jgi:hypothetical protein